MSQFNGEYSINLSPAEWEQVFWYIRKAITTGIHYGRKDYFKQRELKIVKRFTEIENSMYAQIENA